tara:strand:+ start:229 stop:642 length:414 start_codon:yes stop_codon:yes gene_type:complete
MKNKTMKKSPKFSNNTKNITKIFLEMLNTVKLYHWKTYSYAKHNATDALYKDLNKYIDEFIEVLLGKRGTRIPNFSCNIKLENTSSNEIFKKKVFKYRDFLTSMNESFDPHADSDLLNIRDEILGAINQFLYLLTFK